jgi:hypothetical protein
MGSIASNSGGDCASRFEHERHGSRVSRRILKLCAIATLFVMFAVVLPLQSFAAPGAADSASDDSATDDAPTVPLTKAERRARRGPKQVPTPMALAEVYLSLQTGVVDGQENPLSTIFAQKFFEVQKYLNLTAHIITPQIPLVNAKFFRALPEGDRTILLAAFAEGARVNDEAARKAETTLRDELAKRGMTVIEPDRASFQAAMQPVYAKYEDIWGKGVYQQLLSLK